MYSHDIGHMTNMTATTIYGKNTLKTLSGISGTISTKFGM